MLGVDLESFQYINTFAKVNGDKIEPPAKMFQVRNEGQRKDLPAT